MANEERPIDRWWLPAAALLWLATAAVAGFAAWHYGIAEINNASELQVLLIAIVVAAFWKVTAIPLSIARFYAFEHVGRRLFRLRSNRAATRNFARRSGFDFDGAVRPQYERQLQELQQSIKELIQLAGSAESARETVQRCQIDRIEDARYVGEEFVNGRIVVFLESYSEEQLDDLRANARSPSVRVAAQRALDGEEWR
ncbi:MAG: hypothetical protein OXI41_01980 [Chloroflexota bacterium]|nr:hypothetical protein [Chloroflexota bacterium]MDE2895184.1 hypothetical protein [Chloroflexota bacterium]